jgi:hypothetical protein
MLTIPDPYGLESSDALTLAKERQLLPTSLSSTEIRELDSGLKARSVFSARTTNATYLSALQTRVERYLAKGYEGDLATLRVELKKELARAGYTPEKGFPGDKALGIPPAKPGSIQDLSSDRRINLILRTQLRLMTGKAQRNAGLDPRTLQRYPAWELIRTLDREVPRNWAVRWVKVGGTLYGPNKNRMIALKTDPIWQAIGNPSNFDDALDVDHPPFAYESGMGWQQIKKAECIELGVIIPAPDPSPTPTSEATPPTPPTPEQTPPPPPTPSDFLPPAVTSTDGLTPTILARLKSTLGTALKAAKKITWRWIFGQEEINTPTPPPPTETLDLLVDLATAAHERLR